VDFAGKAAEVSLRVAKPAANLFSDALASAGFRIAADIDADESVHQSATNGLANLASHNPS
jgi:6,7-dimethyl-8-ribityllumazine synthase